MQIEEIHADHYNISGVEGDNITMGHFSNLLYDTYLQIPISDIKKNKPYILHGYLISNTNSASLSVVYNDNGTTTEKSFNVSSSWTEIIVNITSLQGDSIDFRFSPGEYYIHNWKLELGSTISDWTPSPLDAKYDVLEIGSTVKQLANSITSKVWQTDIDTATEEINETMTEVGQDASKIYWLVKSGDSMSNMTLTDTAYTLIAKNINLKGNAIFTSFLSDDNTTINGGKIATNSITADKINVTDLYSLKATIGGYSITEYNIQGGTVGMTSITDHGWAFWAGAEGAANSGNAAFRVGHDGSLYATNAHITGEINAISGKIAQWGLHNNSINSTTSDGKYFAGMTVPNNADTDWVFVIGKRENTSVDWDFPWFVRADGYMYAKNADISGTVRVTSGTIGSWNINEQAIYATTSDGKYKAYIQNPQYVVGAQQKDAWVFSCQENGYANWRVTAAGEMYANNAKIVGGNIGGWKINNRTIETNNNNGFRGISMGSNFINFYSWYDTDAENFVGGLTTTITDGKDRQLFLYSDYGDKLILGYKSADNALHSAITVNYDNEGSIYLNNKIDSDICLRNNACLTNPSNQKFIIWGNNEGRGLHFGVDYNSDGSVLHGWHFRPCQTSETDNVPDLGTSSNPWDALYVRSGVVETSDRKRKNSIKELDEETCIAITSGLKPSSYKLNDGTSGRTHYGFIAQDVEDLLKELGINPLNFAALIKAKKVNMYQSENDESIVKNYEGEYEYSLRYNEFVPIAFKALQYCLRKIDEQQEEIDKLKNTK